MAIDPRNPLTPVGAGQPTPRLDPSGLVPVNRTQPMATDGAEAQRLMERRLGSMPPSSFAGAGAGFVPVRPGIGQFADRATAMANMEQFAKPEVLPQLSGEAQRQVALSQGLGAPTPPKRNPVASREAAVRDVLEAGKADAQSRLAARGALKAQRVEDRTARQAGRTISRVALQQRIADLASRQGQPQGTPGGGLLGLRRGGM